MDDTSFEIAEKIREMIRLKTPDELLKMTYSMYATSRYLIVRSILEENPNISNSDLRCEFFLKFYGKDFSPEQREKIVQRLRLETIPFRY